MASGTVGQLHTSELKVDPIAMLYVCSGVTGLSNSIYIDTELTFDFDNFWIRCFPFFE